MVFDKIGNAICEGTKIGGEAADLPCFVFDEDAVDLGDFGGTKPILGVFREISCFLGDGDIVGKSFIFMAVDEYPAVEMEEDDFVLGKRGDGAVDEVIWF